MAGTPSQGAFPSFNLVNGIQMTDRFEAGGQILAPDRLAKLLLWKWQPAAVLWNYLFWRHFHQNKLLSLFQSMDFHHHASMAQQAAATFDALDVLRVDYRAFRDRVDELISRASLFSKIDQMVESNRGLVDLYSHEKIEFEDVSRAHAETVAELEAAKERLRLLKREADQLWEEVLCCETENQEIEKRLDLKSRDGGY